MERYSSVTLHVSPKNPISAEKLKITFTKIQILPQNIFLSGLVQNKLKLYVFEMDFMKNQLRLRDNCSLLDGHFWTLLALLGTFVT